ncbi:MAG: hypothetical protein JNL94_12855 [Planctomycetes bacterium]|nr:hypothetical protein [Planctomycetota bacterium]
MTNESPVIPKHDALACIACHYELTALPESGNCPECGMPIAETRRLVDGFFGTQVVGEARDVGAAAIISRGLRISAIGILLGGFGLALSIVLGAAAMLLAGLGAILVTAGWAAVVHGVLKMKRGGTMWARGAVVVFVLAIGLFGTGLVVVFGTNGPNDFGPFFFLGAVLLHFIAMGAGFASVHRMVAPMMPTFASTTRLLSIASIVGPILFIVLVLSLSVFVAMAIGGAVGFAPFIAVIVLLAANALAMAVVFLRTAERLSHP